MPRPQDCRDMAEVRAEIDRIDQDLVRLMAERAGYIARAAELKKNAEDVVDRARVEAIVAKVRESAAAAGLEPDIADATWRAMIEAFIAHEAELFRNKAKG